MEGGTAQLSVVILGVPLATYIKEGGREEVGQVGRARGSPTWTHSPSRIRPPPLSFLPLEGKEGGEKGKEGGGRPPPLVQFGLGRGRRPLPHGPSPLSQLKPTNFPGGFR